MATRDEIKQVMVNRVIQERLVDPATNQPMPAMNSVLEAVTDGIMLQEAGPGFGKVKIGPETVEADTAGDTLELVAGDNIALTTDTVNDRVTVAVTPIGASGLQDGAATDAKVGERTVNQEQAPAGSTGTLTQLFSWIVNRIRAITGAANWFDNPVASLASIWAKFNASTGHKHTGAADDAPKISFSDIAGAPSSFTPSPHKSTHAFGGSDALTPEDIGAVNKAGDTMTGNLILYGVHALLRHLTSWGSWARGLLFQKEDGTTDAGIAAYGVTGDSVQQICIGFGAEPWIGNPGLKVTSTGVTIQSDEGSSPDAGQLQIKGVSANTGIELGRTDGVSSLSYIDFHTGATAVDYDSRIIASGGSGVSGGGSLDIQCTNLTKSGYTIWHAGNFDPASKANVNHTHGSLDTSGAWNYSNTPYGYIQFGPANTGYAHIYTDRPVFYFNKDLSVNGNTVWHAGNLPVPIPVTSLKKATGSWSYYNSGTSNVYVAFSVNQYALASPMAKVAASGQYGNANSIGYVYDSTSYVRQWNGYIGAGDTYYVTWDYLTASGHPRIWAIVDDAGNVVSMWEAEDPADEESPDECPIGLIDDKGNSIIPTGGAVVLVQFPTELQLVSLKDILAKTVMPKFASRGIWATCKTSHKIVQTIFDREMQSRGLEPLPDVREAFVVQDVDKRNWRIQLWLRAMSRVRKDHRAFTLIPLFEEMFRVDKRTGKLEFK